MIFEDGVLRTLNSSLETYLTYGRTISRLCFVIAIHVILPSLYHEHLERLHMTWLPLRRAAELCCLVITNLLPYCKKAILIMKPVGKYVPKPLETV
jgi:hypothetical protein